MKEVIEFYNKYDEDDRLKSKTHLPEYLITMKYIKKYLTPNSKILEIGAGTGRYSIALADMGYDVTSVELVPHNIEILKTKIKAEADAEKTRIASEAQAKANKELSSSITDELIRMKEAEAHYKNGWVTVQGTGTTVVDATEK